MKLLHYKSSPTISLGIELEFQIINPANFDLATKAKEIIRSIDNPEYEGIIKPEITQSMIEINSSIHQNPQSLLEELIKLRTFLLQKADLLNIRYCGGGTHPFQKWSLRKVFPTNRFKNLTRQYQYLSKRSTVFGEHIHIGCPNANKALYLTHALTRYVPHLIAITASSPYYQGIDTGYHSSRPTVFNVFPSSGVIPYLITWDDFSHYFYKLRSLGIIGSMKDLYWDIRPKPEFGTVEIRVCDTPLTLKKAVIAAAYAQSIASYLMAEEPIKINRDLYFIYNFNRFQAMRYAFEGDIINPQTLEHKTIAEDILETVNIIEPYIQQMKATEFITQLKNDVIQKNNDATVLRNLKQDLGSFRKMVEKQCEFFEEDNDS